MTPRNLENNATGGATAAATSLPLASLTLASFHALTPELIGASRAALFLRLPSTMQAHAMQDLDDRIRAQSDRLWAAEQTSPGGETP